MADQVAEVKEKTDIIEIIGEYVDLKPAGRNFKGLCPFHGEKSPSFMVSQELQIYKCFGCGKGGDVFTFLEEHEGMSFSESLSFLAERAGIKLEKRAGEDSQTQQIIEVNEFATRLYHYILRKHELGKRARHYILKERGLHLETIDTFQIGYAPEGANTLVKQLEKRKISLNLAETAGLLYIKQNNAFDRFRGRVIFPIYDSRGNPIALGGRILPELSEKGYAKYINSPETPVYHKSEVLFGLHLAKGEIRRAKYAVIVEGEMDMISAFQVGIKNTVAIKGTAFTQEHLQILSRYTDTIVLALDSDFAGDAAAVRSIQMAQEQGFTIKVVKMGEYKDPDEYASKDPEGLMKAIEEADDVWQFLINVSFSKHKAETGQGKAAISKELIPVLQRIPDRIVQAHYMQHVASRLGVAIEDVLAQMKREEKPYTSVTQKEKYSYEAGEQKTRRDLLEEQMIGMALQSNPKFLPTTVDHKLSRKILVRILAHLRRNADEYSISSVVRTLPEELQPEAQRLSMIEFGEDLPTDTELAEVVHEYEKYILKERLHELARDISKAEQEENEAAVRTLEEELTVVTEHLSRLEEKN